ncbi:hypothetical protein IEO21_03797 [Rhodonia placenta]|uniref:Uncharacterized protein n=1 Tax=Rhodonia placenta TaxID=104341 RepID=A0A8H7P584_9APHY|nr:hypothetical protein IEO21_03797 [Postia placenta]
MYLVNVAADRKCSCEAVNQFFVVSGTLVFITSNGWDFQYLQACSGRRWLPTLAILFLGLVPVTVEIYHAAAQSNAFVVFLVVGQPLCAFTNSISQSLVNKVKRNAIKRVIHSPLAIILLKTGTLNFTLFLFLNVAQLATINVQQAAYVSSLVAPITLITIWHFLILMSLRQLRHRQNGNENTEIQGTYPQSTSIEEPDSSFLNNKGAPLEFAANYEESINYRLQRYYGTLTSGVCRRVDRSVAHERQKDQLVHQLLAGWELRCTAMSLLFIISRYIALVYVVAAVLVDSRWETDQVYAVSGRCWLPTLAVATLGVVPMGVAILDGIEEGHPFTMSLGSVSACGLTSSLSLKVYHKMRREPLMRTMQAPLPTLLVKAGVVQFMYIPIFFR